MTWLLEMKNITKTFGAVKAVDNVSLRLNAGEVVSLCGENGSGKSTLMKVLCGIYPHGSYEGEIIFAGETLQANHIRDTERKGIAIIHQELALVKHLTVLENIFLGAEISRHGLLDYETMTLRCQKLLAQVNLPISPDTRVGDLGLGQQQLVEIAKALNKQVRLLILDEPTAGVDIELRRSMWGFLKDLNDRGTTIILTTHYLEEAEMLCRNIGIIQHGELVENTSMKALLSKLKSETFILDLAPKSPVPKLEGYQYQLVDTSTLEVEVLREQGINSVFAQLSAQGVQVLSMRNKANRLEELFVTLVHERKGESA
ncbi:ATP-binding cassette domain-containing protein [Klebsiella pneumoniae]